MIIKEGFNKLCYKKSYLRNIVNGKLSFYTEEFDINNAIMWINKIEDYIKVKQSQK